MALLGIVLLAALLRLPTLGSRSLWLDEGAEFQAVGGSFGHLWDRVVDVESAPPLSYLVQWLFAQAFGTSEAALRVPDALAGIAAVPVLYLAARELGGRRAGLIAAGLAAANPFLVWHSQDARPYGMLVLAVALTLLALARGRLWWWAAAAVAALLTHYVAIFVVAPQAVWLLWTRRDARAPVAVAALALVPIAILASQQADDRSQWIAGVGVLTRLAQVPAGFVAGYQLSLGATILVCAALAIPLLAAAWRAPRAPLVLGLLGIGLPLLFVPVHDLLLPRTVIAALPPLLLAAGAGLAAWRHGALAAVAVCALWSVIVLATATDPKFRREDWRAAVAATRGAGAVLVYPPSGVRVVPYYDPGRERVDGARVPSVAVLVMGQSSGVGGCRIPRVPGAPAGEGATTSGRCWRVQRIDGERTVRASRYLTLLR